MENKGTKRLTKDKSYNRPDKTYQETLSNQEIKEKLKEYKKVDDIKTVSIGTHIRYFNIDHKTKEKTFRLGGTLNKIDPEGKYVILSNGSVTWSVQVPNAQFFQKMSEAEFKDELKKELKKELMSEIPQHDEDIEIFKKEIKNLKTKLEQYKNNETEYRKKIDEYKEVDKDNKKKIETLSKKIISIQSTIKNDKSKK
jgi:predicted amino acid racemase